MPLSPSVTTGVMIAGTVLTAAGLNLGVLALNQPPSGAGQSVQAAGAAAPADPGVETTVALLPEGTAGMAQNPEERAMVDETAAPETQAVTLQVQAPAGGSSAAGASGGESAAPKSDAPSTRAAPTTAAPQTNPPRTQASTTTAPATQASTTAAPATQAPTTAVPTTPAPTQPAPNTEYLTYEWDGIVDVVLALHDGSTLEFWSATPEANWVYKVEDRVGREITVKLFDTRTESEAEFKAKLENGRVKISKES